MCCWRGFELPRDLGLLAGSFFLLTWYSFRLKHLPYREILTDIAGLRGPGEERPLGASGDGDREVLEKTCRALNFYLRYIYRSNRPCLRRTAVLYHRCRRLGLEARAVVGVCREKGELLSHAWLLLEGAPFQENPAALARYRSIMEG